MAGKPVGSKGRSDKIDEAIIRTSERATRSRNAEDHADANSADRVLSHLALKGGGTTDVPMEGEDG